MPRKRKINWKAVGAAAVTVTGIVASPPILALLPAKVALGVTALGAALQAVTKALTHAPE